MTSLRRNNSGCAIRQFPNGKSTPEESDDSQTPAQIGRESHFLDGNIHHFLAETHLGTEIFLIERDLHLLVYRRV